jgi:hypothetical protein
MRETATRLQICVALGCSLEMLIAGIPQASGPLLPWWVYAGEFALCVLLLATGKE